MEKDFNLTDPEDKTVKIGGSDDSINKDFKTEEAEAPVKPVFKTPSVIPESKPVTPTPIFERSRVTPPSFSQPELASSVSDHDKTVAVSRPGVQNVNMGAGAGANSYSPSQSSQSTGGIRTTYVPDSSQIPRSNSSYSSYSMNGNNKADSNGSVKSKKKSDSNKGKFTFGKAIAIVLITMLLTTTLNFGMSYLLDDNSGSLGTKSGKSTEQTAVAPDEVNPPADVDNTPEYIAVTPDGSVESAVAVAADSVVEISTEIVVSGGFFGDYISSGAGSGVIIDATNGYIITCAHVIDGASTVTVKLRNGDTYDAEIIGSDAQTDIAVIRIDGENLVKATLADSDELVVGQTAIAIGNPLGTLGGTVSKGIVSALDREITIDGQSYSLLQIDTSINPGNSGGGLFDAVGNLIGIVNAKSGGDGSGTTIEGLGFAIPINDAMTIATDLIDDGFVGNRAYLGISVVEYDGTQSVDRSLYDYIYAGGIGVYFVEYQEGQSGGFVFGDKIIAIDGNEVATRAEISSILSDYSVGDTVTVTVSRLNSERGRRQMIDVELTLISGVPAES